MKLTIEPTAEIVEFQGVPCRVWSGTTESGATVGVLVAAVGCDPDDAATARRLAEVLTGAFELPPGVTHAAAVLADPADGGPAVVILADETGPKGHA